MAASLSHLRPPNLSRRTLLIVNNLFDEKISSFSNAAVLCAQSIQNSVDSVDFREEVVEYPPIKTKYPPGKWGEMEPSYAWLWQNKIDALKNIPDVKGRQDYITCAEMAHIDALPYQNHPDYFNFAKYATKTAVFPWHKLPSGHGKVESSSSLVTDELLENLKKNISDCVLIEQEAVHRKPFPNSGDMYLIKKRSNMILRSIFETLITTLNKTASYLHTCQYDENVSVRAVWDRYGIERKRRHRLGPTNFKVDDVMDQRLLSTLSYDGMIRTHLPLPQLQPRTSGLSTESEMPTLSHVFKAFGVRKRPSKKLPSIIAGHVLGDPCEYGHVGYIVTNRLENLDEKFGPEVAQECRLGKGLMSTFTWLAAQAYNQGFSGFLDLTYPLTSQTVLSDGRNISLLACQLNTLELWKPDSANDIVNLCWASEEMPLYDCIENGQVKNFNEDLLRLLINMFLWAPEDRGYDMKPTITEKETDLHLKNDFIPEKVEEVIEEKEEEYII